MYDELLLLSLLINWLIFREDDARFRDTTLSFACNWEIIFKKRFYWFVYLYNNNNRIIQVSYIQLDE